MSGKKGGQCGHASPSPTFSECPQPAPSVILNQFSPVQAGMQSFLIIVAKVMDKEKTEQGISIAHNLTRGDTQDFPQCVAKSCSTTQAVVAPVSKF